MSSKTTKEDHICSFVQHQGQEFNNRNSGLLVKSPSNPDKGGFLTDWMSLSQLMSQFYHLHLFHSQRVKSFPSCLVFPQALLDLRLVQRNICLDYFNGEFDNYQKQKIN